MKRFFTKIALLVAVAAVGFSGCQKEEKANCSDIMADYAKIDDLMEKFETESTTANCNALKKATIDMFNKLKDCPGVDKSAIEPLINEYKDDDCTTVESDDDSVE